MSAKASLYNIICSYQIKQTCNYLVANSSSPIVNGNLSALSTLIGSVTFEADRKETSKGCVSLIAAYIVVFAAEMVAAVTAHERPAVALTTA